MFFCLDAHPALGAPDPLSRLVPPAAGASACFSRTYDAAHLQAHPAQATRSILLSYHYDAEPSGPNPVERIRIDERGGRTLLHRRQLRLARGCRRRHFGQPHPAGLQGRRGL